MDHNSLCWLINAKDLSCQLRHWGIQLQEYNYIIHYVKGKLNQAAEIFSRNPLNLPVVHTICISPNHNTESTDEESTPAPQAINNAIHQITLTVIQQASLT